MLKTEKQVFKSTIIICKTMYLILGVGGGLVKIEKHIDLIFARTHFPETANIKYQPILCNLSNFNTIS